MRHCGIRLPRERQRRFGVVVVALEERVNGRLAKEEMREGYHFYFISCGKWCMLVSEDVGMV